MRNLSVIKGLYQGNGVTRRWAIPFEYNDKAQIFVTITTYDEGDYTYRVLDSTEYTIDEDSVEIVYPKTDEDAPIPSTQYLTVWRDTDLLQLMDLTNQGAAWPDSIEAALDKLHQIVQELAEGLSRSLKVDIGDPQTPDEKLIAIQDYVLAAAESSRSASASEANAQRSAEAAATSEVNAAESERLAGGYADTATDAASRAEDSAISARAYTAPDYDNETTYQAGDVVTFTDGNSYRALQETTGHEPPNIIYWQKVTDYVGDDFFQVDEYGYIVPMDSPSHSRYWRVDQNGYIVPIEGGDGGYRPDTRSLYAEYLNVTNEGYVKHLRADDVNAGNLSATGNVTAGMLTTPQANVTTLTANAVNAGNVTKVLNTVNDMLSNNLSVGMTARTLGYYAVDDGCGETYVITNSANNDNVDGDKIIQLNNGLYAKRITQSDLPDFFLGGFFTSESDQNARLYSSLDGVNYSDLLNTNIAARDISICYHNQYFYLVKNCMGAETFEIYKSHNLKDWTSRKYTVFTKSGGADATVWAPELFIDDDEKAYVYFSYPWGMEQVGTATRNQYALDMYVSICDDINVGDFQQATLISLPESNSDSVQVRTNYIDGAVTKINDSYYMIVKNEHQPSLQTDGGYLGLNLHLFKSSNPVSDWVEVTTFPLKYNMGVEGGYITVVNDTVYIYADSHHNYNIPTANRNDYGGEWVWTARLADLETGPYQLAQVAAARNLRHGSVINITNNYAKRVIANNGVDFAKAISPETIQPREVDLFKANGYQVNSGVSTKYTITNFSPVQNTVYNTRAYICIDNIINANNATDFFVRFVAGNDTRLCIKASTGDNRIIWAGNDRFKNRQMLHFKLNGTTVSYVGTLTDLLGIQAYNIANKAVRLAQFNLTKNGSLTVNIKVFSNSWGNDPDWYENNYKIKVWRVNNTANAAYTKTSGNTEHNVKLIKTGDYQYELWGKNQYEYLATEITYMRITDIFATVFDVLSLEPSEQTNFPTGTEVPISN